MLVKLLQDIQRNMTTTCGEVDMILGTQDYAKLNVAVCPDIQPNIAHYHEAHDEIYWVLDGWIDLHTWDPKTGYAAQRLAREELALIPIGVHHVIMASSPANQLAVLMVPGFRGETPSDKFPPPDKR